MAYRHSTNHDSFAFVANSDFFGILLVAISIALYKQVIISCFEICWSNFGSELVKEVAVCMLQLQTKSAWVIF